MRRIALAVLSVLLLTGCVSTNSVMLGGTGTYPEIKAGEVRLFLSEKDVPGRFEKIALITAKAGESFHDEDDLIRAMRKRAASMGANGLIIEQMEEPHPALVVADAVFDLPVARAKTRGVAIRLLPPAETLPDTIRF